jgi:hypothetical protein
MQKRLNTCIAEAGDHFLVLPMSVLQFCDTNGTVSVVLGGMIFMIMLYKMPAL